MALAERANLDLDQVARAIGSSQAASPQVVRNSRRMADGDHQREIVFSGRLRQKDTLYGVRLDYGGNVLDPAPCKISSATS